VGAAVGVEQDVAGLDVAVDHPPAVHVGEGVGERGAERDHVAQRQRTAADALREGVALDELHDEVGAPVVVTDVVHGDQAGVRERREREDLAAVAGLGALLEIPDELSRGRGGPGRAAGAAAVTTGGPGSGAGVDPVVRRVTRRDGLAGDRVDRLERRDRDGRGLGVGRGDHVAARPEHLDRDVAAEELVAGPVDVRGAAAADQVTDGVPAADDRGRAGIGRAHRPPPSLPGVAAGPVPMRDAVPDRFSPRDGRRVCR
jgi:hypothetical protein